MPLTNPILDARRMSRSIFSALMAVVFLVYIFFMFYSLFDMAVFSFLCCFVVHINIHAHANTDRMPNTEHTYEEANRGKDFVVHSTCLK